MTTFTVLKAERGPEKDTDWGKKAGIKMRLSDGSSEFDAEWWTKATTPLPAVGSTQEFEIEDSSYGKKAKRPKGGGGGGGGRGRSPEETKAIQRQHSQEMSLRYAAIQVDLDHHQQISLDQIKAWTNWFEADIGSGLGGAVGGSSVPPASPPVAAESSVADSNRKRATSTRLTKAGIPHRETQQAIVKAFCGEVATVAGLDAIDAALANRDWHTLFDEHGIPRPPEIPDTTDLPPLDVVA